jgi:beta-lactamase regulating signal transducer with metallopeptidase domain
MNGLFVFALHNTFATLILAICVCGLTRLWRNPPVAHALWLLVLLRLVAPPVLPIDYSSWLAADSTDGRDPIIEDAREMAAQHPAGRIGFTSRPPARAIDRISAASVENRGYTGAIRLLYLQGRPILMAIWFGGAVACAAVIATRIVRLERRLRGALPASERLQRLAVEIAAELDVSRAPELRCVESVDVPLLWCAGLRPTVVLPARLLSLRDDQRTALILAHEIAHLRRRDHWVRAVELLVSIVYWWNPLAWAIRRQIHEAEELCCDAWVRRAFPELAKRYAEVLFEAAQSLGASPLGAQLLPASLFLSSFPLKARIEMLLESRFAPHVSKKSWLAIVLLALVSLPLCFQNAETARADSKDEPAAPARNSDKPTSEFPYAVRFEQGTTRFADGDKITVLEVRGTAETFAPGNIYWIKGSYKLHSHNKAMLAAYTTAMDAEHASGSTLKVQSSVVDRGEGEFTLFLPMSCRGWPHVSFYPAEGGEGFGGNYFGTGDSTLKKWWGEK